MTKGDVFRAIERNIKLVISLVLGFITFGVLNIIFTKRIPIDTTKNYTLAGSKHAAKLADAVTNGLWFPLIYSLLVAMTVYIILKRPKFWFGLIEVNIALVAIFAMIQYHLIF